MHLPYWKSWASASHDFRKETFDLITKPIVIGDGCWIAAGAFIGPGAVIPAGTMVTAGEVWKRERVILNDGF